MVLTSSRVIVIKPNAIHALGADVSSFELSVIVSFEFVKYTGTSFLVIKTAGVPTVGPTLNGSTSGYSFLTGARQRLRKSSAFH
jgi:hypothetical protein